MNFIWNPLNIFIENEHSSQLALNREVENVSHYEIRAIPDDQIRVVAIVEMPADRDKKSHNQKHKKLKKKGII